MHKKLYSTLLLLLFAVGAWAQSGTIKGRVLDKSTKEPLPFANVVAELNGTQAGGAQTDFDGYFTIKPLTPGKYDLKASFVGYSTGAISGVIVSADKITFQDVILPKTGVDITQVEIQEFKIPVIDKGNASTQATITQEDIKVAPTRDVRAVASTTAGVAQRDEGDALNIRGSRSDATDYYIDGIKVRGSTNLPQAGIEQVTVVTGGVPAQYGDATGGIINITTRGPSKDYFGGIEYSTSELFDEYGYNLVGGNISGPLFSRKTDKGKEPVVGFFISGEFQSEADPDPSSIGMYKVKDDKFNFIQQNPLRPNPVGQGTLRESEFITLDDLEKINIKQNTKSQGFRIQGKFDYSPIKNLNLTLGGSYDRSRYHQYIQTYSLFNHENNPQITDNTWRVFGRVTQKFGSTYDLKEGTSKSIKNAYFSLQLDYSKYTQTNEDDSHEDRYFNYGYVGQFNTSRVPLYAPGIVIQGNDTFNVTELVTYVDNGVSFNPYDNTGTIISPQTTNYTSQYYNIVGTGTSATSSLSAIQNGGGLLNGQRPTPSYSLWHNTGRQNNLYQVTDNSQWRVSLFGSADIKNHAIRAGIEYEQRIDRQYALNPIGLWTIMRQLSNIKNAQLDLNNPINLGNPGGPFANGDTVIYNALYVQGASTGFFENVRQRLGLSNLDYLDIDSYDPSVFSLDLFNPDEILNNGNPLVNYFGYDYLGEKTTGEDITFEQFFNEVDDKGNFTRKIDAFRPVYGAFFIQDNFAFRDLIFNVGVRIDRFDANQKVLKDKYLLYPARTAGEVAGLGAHPSNIGSDYVVYVDDLNNPTSIVGYRDNDIWYDATGAVVNNPGVLAAATSSGTIQPYLINPNDDIKSKTFNVNGSFTDYDPQINVMPRIAFSFPISDEALFFAHYDVLTQRPPSRLRMNPIQWLFITDAQGTVFNNPDLKPEKTIDYEVGFKQALSKSSALSISAFYRELRDQIQIVNVNYAYPIQYTTFDNVDFGTVKGLSFSYDLRRTGNVRLTASYTLQFAEGTGSGDASSLNLINSGQPNLKVLIPLDFDQRHNIVTSIDYRYGSGKDYNGPMWFGKQFLSNFGTNFIFRASSGTPYSQQANITQEGAFGIVQQAKLKGGINSARLPWQFRVDMRIDKSFDLKYGKENSKSAELNVYLLIQNLLDNENIISVYRATGNPDDDGYLTAPEAQAAIASKNSTQAFIDQYRIKVDNPDNYSIPIRARLGLALSF